MTKRIVKQYIGESNGYTESGLNIILIGIQGPKDMEIFFNGSNYPIILGPLGIYQLELTDGSSITSFQIQGLKNGEKCIIDTILEVASKDLGGNR